MTNSLARDSFVFIDVSGGASIVTKNKNSAGIRVDSHASGTKGGITIGVSGGSTVKTEGSGSHGIQAENSLRKSMQVLVDTDALVQAIGQNASGIRFGSFDGGFYRGVAAADADGYPRQVATVRGSVVGGSGDDAAGVYLVGGGKVVVGQKGSIRAASASGTSIRSARMASTDAAPNLRIDLLPGGRPVHELLMGKVVNNGGRTELAVNGELLFDSSDWNSGNGPRRWVPNGARDITLSAGFAPTSVPDNLSTKEMRFDLESSYVERIAARAPVYQALPGFLLRLDDDAFAGPRLKMPGSPVWVRLASARGSHIPKHATVGAEHKSNGFEAAIGVDTSLGDGLTGSLSLRTVFGSASVSSGFGGGNIKAKGFGVAGKLRWNGADGVYAAGKVSTTRFDLDVESSARGVLASGAEATVLTLGAQAGRRFVLNQGVGLTAQFWIDRSRASLDGMTDRVNSQVSIADGTRVAAGAGIELDDSFEMSGGQMSLRGSLGLEQVLDDETAVAVSGETLLSQMPGTRVLLGVGMDWRLESAILAADLSADGLGSGDRSFLASFNMNIPF